MSACKRNTGDGLHRVMDGHCIDCKLPIHDSTPAMRPIPVLQNWYFGPKDNQMFVVYEPRMGKEK